MNIAKSLGTPFPQNTSGQLLLRVEGLQASNFINPNKAGLFEGSFFWEGGDQIDPPLTFPKELIKKSEKFRKIDENS